MTDNPYTILGISETASFDEVKRAYRQKAKAYHPDLHPDDPNAQAKMNAVNQAYEILSDPAKTAEWKASQSDFGSVFGGFGRSGAGSARGYSEPRRSSGFYWNPYTGDDSAYGSSQYTGSGSGQGSSYGNGSTGRSRGSYGSSSYDSGSYGSGSNGSSYGNPRQNGSPYGSYENPYGRNTQSGSQHYSYGYSKRSYGSRDFSQYDDTQQNPYGYNNRKRSSGYGIFPLRGSIFGFLIRLLLWSWIFRFATGVLRLLFRF